MTRPDATQGQQSAMIRGLLADLVRAERAHRAHSDSELGCTACGASSELVMYSLGVLVGLNPAAAVELLVAAIEQLAARGS